MTLRTRLALFVLAVVFVPMLVVAVAVVITAGGALDGAALVILVAGASAAALAGFLLMRLYVDLRVTRPIRAMTKAARRLSTTEPEVTHLRKLATTVEVEELAAAFTDILERVHTSMAELESSQRAFRRALAGLGGVLESGDDRQRIVQVLLETSLLLVPGRAAVFWGAAGREVVARLSVPSGAGVPPGIRLRAGEGLAGWSAQLQEVGITPRGPRRVAPVEPDHASAVAVPIMTDGRLFGVLAVYGHTADEDFTSTEIEMLGAFVHQAETAITTTFLHEEASRLSITDGLTGVWNRRWFEMQAVRELERSVRFDEPFAVVMCDIDDFKALNDSLGHQAGDAALVELSQRLMESTREVDAVARYGGEEFVLVLPRASEAEARRVCERVRAAIADEPFSIDPEPVTVTVSFGVACFPTMGPTVHDLVAAADRALYQAKANGKNRVEVACPDATPTEDPRGRHP